MCMAAGTGINAARHVASKGPSMASSEDTTLKDTLTGAQGAPHAESAAGSPTQMDEASARFHSASEERLAQMLEAVSDGVWELDARSKKLWWNELYDELRGTRPKATHRAWQWWINRIHPEDRDRVVQSCEAVLNSEAKPAERW